MKRAGWLLAGPVVPPSAATAGALPLIKAAPKGTKRRKPKGSA